jgi:membrane-associated HD superfamily phosphohydrolase
LSVTALIAYILLVFAASGALLRTCETGDATGRKRAVAAGAFAVLSALALPWSGLPMSIYFGVGSWMWFPAAAISIFLQRDDGKKFCDARRKTAAANICAVTVSLCLFMTIAGVPGDIPGIEGFSAATALSGIVNPKMVCAFVMFFVSAVLSFACVCNPASPSMAQRLLSFSCSSFSVLALTPPAHVFISGLTPRNALLMDMAFYFFEAETLHLIVFRELYSSLVSKWRYAFAAFNAALTLSGIYFLFSCIAG